MSTGEFTQTDAMPAPNSVSADTPTGDPVTVTIYHDRKQIWKQYTVLGGMQHGKYTEWYPSGALATQCQYHYGQLHGEYLLYYFDGGLLVCKNYVHGRLCGEYLKWDQRGRFNYYRYYNDDVLDKAITNSVQIDQAV